MQTVDEIRAWLDEIDGWFSLKEIVRDEGGAIEGVAIEHVAHGRDKGSGDYDGYHWVFSINGIIFRVDGWYSSYNGSEMEDIKDMYPVTSTIKTYKEWVRIGS